MGGVRRLQGLPDLAFAYRLAAKLGVADVGGLVDSLTKEQFNAWIASAILDGWYNPWSKTAEILAQINNSTNRLELMQSSNPSMLQSRQTWRSGSEIASLLTDFKESKTKTSDMVDIAKKLEAIEESKRGNRNRH